VLEEDPGYIVDGVEYFPCPQQKNMSDCSLFSLGVLLHVINGVAFNEATFSQSTINTFRNELYTVLNAPPQPEINDTKHFVSRGIILSFFPKLVVKNEKYDPCIKYYVRNKIEDMPPNSMDNCSESSSTSVYVNSSDNSDLSDTEINTEDKKKREMTTIMKKNI
jgi:hypothetical protein